MSLQVWLPLNKDPNMAPDITSYRVESNVTRTEDTDGWYKVTDLTHAFGGRWGIYYDFNVKPNTTYTLYVYSKSTTGVSARIGIQSYAGTVTWPTVRDTNTGAEKLTTYSWTTGTGDRIARVYLALTTTATKTNDYVFYKEPKIYEAPQNQGIANVNIIDKGVTYNSSGKLGGCYYFDGIDDRIACSELSLSYPLSICAWFKPTDVTNSNTQYWLSYNTASGGTAGHAIAIGTYQGKLAVWRGAAVYNSFSQTLSNNRWYHIAVTISENKNYYVYLDGAQIYTATCGNNPGSSWLTLGARSNSATGGAGAALYYYKGYMNDARFYNHALTEQEVKQIAQGLVLHYPLNNNGFGGDNLSTLSNTSQVEIPASSTSNYNYFWIVTTGNLTVGETYTFSAEVEVSDNIERCTVYNYNVSPTTSGPITYTFPADGKRHSWTFTATATGLIAYAGVSGSTIGHSAVYKNIKLEKGDKATSYVPRKSESSYLNIIYDISGYQNNGTITGALSTSSETPRYGVCTHFPNTTTTDTLDDKCWITTPLQLNSVDNITVSFWFNKEAITRGGLFTTAPLRNTLTTHAFNDYDKGVRLGASDGTMLSCGSYDTYLPSNNVWYHYAITFDGVNARIYVNGVLKNTSSYSEKKVLKNIEVITLGGNSAGGVHRTAKGWYSDFRLYITALSADDIQELYEMGVE